MARVTPSPAGGSGGSSLALGGVATPAATSTFTATVSKANPVNTANGPVTANLPTGSPAGSLIEVSKEDASVNAVTISGSIRGVGAQTITLSLYRESVLFTADASGSWWPISDHKTVGSLDGRYAAAGGVRQGVPVTNNCFGRYTQSSTLQTAAQTCRSRHIVTTSASDLVLSFGNLSKVVPEDVGVNTYTIRAAIEMPGTGTIVPVTFGGRRDGTLDGGGVLDCDPIPVEVTKGQTLWVRTYISASGTGWWANYATAPGTGNGGVAAGDLTATGAAAISDTFSFAYAPQAIVGTVKLSAAPAVLRVGDSIMDAANEQTSQEMNATNQNGGFLARALNRNFGTVGVAMGGETATQFIAAHRRLLAGHNCKYAVTNYGTNDLAASPTLAAFQATKVAEWQILANRGLIVYQTTITPQTTSTDSWATLANQTVTSKETVRVQWNNWLRGGAPVDSTTLVAVAVGTSGALLAGQSGHPLTGYFDVADQAESARDSGKWKVTGAANYATTDGLHPSAAVHALMATAINTAVFV